MLPLWRADGEERREKSEEKLAMSMPFVEASQESFEAIGAALVELRRADPDDGKRKAKGKRQSAETPVYFRIYKISHMFLYNCEIDENCKKGILVIYR